MVDKRERYGLRSLFMVTSGKRWIGLLAAASGAILIACSSDPAPVAPVKVTELPEAVSIADEGVAIRRFHATRATIGFHAVPEERLTARRDALKNCLKRVQATLQPVELTNCIVFGELSSLDQEGECWVVEVDRGLLGGQIACFNDIGQLVFAWRAPEG